ncbi:MAG: HAMP domain-containing histidine kinase [Cytophagales bacterium]|nr:HAMP domain-containing histidine kinase [Cytophaga sp.]
MKLLSVTTRYFLILIFTMLVVWCVVLYFSLRWTAYIDLDEHLNSRQYELQKALNQHADLITKDSVYKTDFKINAISQVEYNNFMSENTIQKFEDIEIYDELEKEGEFFREMQTVFILNNKYYKLSIITSLLNSDELLMAILVNILFLFVMLFVLMIIINRVILPKLWKPFYETILKVKKYKLDKESEMELSPTNIIEFRELNDSISELIQNNLKVFISQKQFIENASHEMQTPLGIIQNKVYMLMEDPALTNTQAGLIDGITEHLDRLSLLYKTLLLLSKIENNQFIETESVDIAAIIQSYCEDFKDLLEFKHLECTIQSKDSVRIQMNMDLARILCSNLIKNAINHNIFKGFVLISIEGRQLTITNTGKELMIYPELLFERFNKKSEDSASTGLGLAIVHSICQIYNFSIQYKNAEQIHTLSIRF